MFTNTCSTLAPRAVRNGSIALRALSFTAALALAGCSGKERAPEVTVTQSPALPTSTPLPSCEGLKDGDACAQGKHCASGRCVPDTCGDGVVGDGEACDDGNLVANDGCSPSCNLEFIRCANGEFVQRADSCPDDASPSGPNGSPAPTPGECPEPRAIVVSGNVVWNPAHTIATAPAEAEVKVQARGVKDGQVFWKVTKVSGAEVWSADGLANADKANNVFTCPTVTSETTYEGRAFQNMPGCPEKAWAFTIVCVPKTELRPNVTPAPSSADASTPSAVDGGTADGGASLAAMRSERVFAADPGRFHNDACRACVESSCRKYGDFNFDFVGPCLEGTGRSPEFAKACSDAYFCSLNAPDNCGHTLAAPGPAGCLCGAKVEAQECMSSPKKVRGLCKDEWYAATLCKRGDHKCALLKFIDIERPSFYAYGLLECQNTHCADVCAL